jgi:hypothetical protein
LVTPLRGFWADAFFGASPVVASALGIRLGATPRGRFDSNTHFRAARRKVTFLLCRKRGHFYFALTLKRYIVDSPLKRVIAYGPCV